MDQKRMVNKVGKNNQPRDKPAGGKPVSLQPSVPSLAKEQEKVAGVEGELERIAEGEPIPELGPEFREIQIPEKLIPTLPSEVEKAGVTTVPSPTIPWDLQPPAATFALPLTKKKSQAGLALPVVASLRWLAEWCSRLIKITQGKIRYGFKNSESHDT